MKALLAEITKHDPSALLGDHSEVFYSKEDFPSSNQDFEAAFHGQPQEVDQKAIKPFFKESVGNGTSICTWCYISSTFPLQKLHTYIRTWLIQKQIFIEPISNGYVGPRESIGYLTGLNLNLTFCSNLIRQIEDLLDSTEMKAQDKMDTTYTTHTLPKNTNLPPRKIELLCTRLLYPR